MPRTLSALFQDSLHLYNWLLRRGYATLPLTPASQHSDWPLWTVQEEPYLCRDADQALASSGNLFVGAPGWRLWKLQRQETGGFSAIGSSDGCSWDLEGNNAPLEMKVLCSELEVIYPMIIAKAYFLQSPQGAVSALHLTPQELIGENHCLDDSWSVARLVSLFEPILSCCYPYANQMPWHWQLQDNQFPATIAIVAHDIKLPSDLLAAWSYMQQLTIPVPYVAYIPEPLHSRLLHRSSYRQVALQNLKLLSQTLAHAGVYQLLPALQKTHTIISESRYLPLNRATSAVRRGIQLIPNRSTTATPFLGILALPPKEVGEPFAFESLHFKQLAQLAPVYGMEAIVFTFDDLRPKQRKCWGYSWQQGNWKRGLFPIPKAVYVRGAAADPIQEAHRERTLKQLQRLAIPLLNSQPFMDFSSDKLHFAQHLHTLPLRDHTPLTLIYTPKNLEKMLLAYDLVLLKPRYGYESRGIVRIERTLDSPVGSGYRCHYNDLADNLVVWECQDTAELLERLLKLPSLSKFIIQQGIRQATWEGYSLELRLIMQHDGSDWQCLGQVCRLSGRKDLPLITAERESWQPASILEDCFPTKGQGLRQLAEELALEFCHSLTTLGTEQEGASLRAMELSFDFLPSASGHLWILECNSMPSSYLVQIGDDSARRSSLMAKLSYAQRLM